MLLYPVACCCLSILAAIACRLFNSSNRDITDPKDMNFIKKWIEKTKEIYNQKSLSLDKDITEDMF